MSLCPDCGLHFQCVCAALPITTSQLHLALLTHDKEFTRPTNTGHWLEKSLPHCQRYRWSRVEPPADLLHQIQQGSVVPYVLFPSEQSVALSPKSHAASSPTQAPSRPSLFIVLDGTWQEARKMWRQSPCLQALNQVHLAPSRDSIYQLRRNQAAGNLCTLEVGCELLHLIGETQSATDLLQFLQYAMRAFQADKSGHAL